MFTRTILPAFILPFLLSTPLHAQERITLKKAVALGVDQYGMVKAKQAYAAASKAMTAEARREYVPNLGLSAQADYGTVNGQFGPQYSFGGILATAAGPTTATQNWTAAFGGLYLANINWDFFAFGRAHEKIKTAKAAAVRDYEDWQQEIFKQKVRVAGAYLNLIAAQQLTRSYEKNLTRADTFRQIIITRAKNGLVAGVDSSQANAEYSSAQIQLTKALDYQQEQNSQLAQLMGEPMQDFLLDSFFVSRVPEISTDTTISSEHPLLKWYQSRIDVSREQTKYFKTFYYPTFSFAGFLQTRGSGFGYDYATNPSSYNTDYWQGITPTRTNYLLGIGISWNLTQPYRMSQQVKAQKLTSKGLQYEYELTNQQIEAQLKLADVKIKNALINYAQVKVQVKAASDAYTQKAVLYQNGLTTLVDLTQASYALTRAETDRDIAYANVWQALLLKAAAVGDFSLFENQL